MEEDRLFRGSEAQNGPAGHTATGADAVPFRASLTELTFPSLSRKAGVSAVTRTSTLDFC